ncbi:thioredoxin family protein [Muricauda sp. JGD-17]|uniref:Thioredoxin family protein n=1 Tax=Flagellimonas ochracea TaxID=2696472 RepID=A0A964WXD1_9FLAO|nr:thioredoxin family protein [Allomuricauda ochracea]NAY92006.1 thioredoxin family protein [Allomuricauda ochracea]
MELLKGKTMASKQELVQNATKRSMVYKEYKKLVQRLAEESKTTGFVQSEANINYTQLNNRRMGRWDKTLKISNETAKKITKIDSKLLFLVLTESWCGDAAPSLPVMNKIAELNPNIELKVVLRDENLELMDAFLTRGARSIPKLIILDKEKEKILGEWGPRPSIATQMAAEYKQKHGKLSPEFKKDLQVWYNKDKGKNILEDLVALLTLK